MPFDPSLPANNSPNSSAQMRGQLVALFDLIQALPHVTGAMVNFVSTGNPGDPAQASASFEPATGTVHFNFLIPRGADGGQGPPGEVTTVQMDGAIQSAISSTARNPNGVSPLNLTISDPPTQNEVVQIMDKLSELIAALVR